MNRERSIPETFFVSVIYLLSVYEIIQSLPLSMHELFPPFSALSYPGLNSRSPDDLHAAAGFLIRQEPGLMPGKRG